MNINSIKSILKFVILIMILGGCLMCKITKSTVSTSEIKGADSVFVGLNGLFKDERDSKRYGWVKIGDQIWMSQCLAYKTTSGCKSFRNFDRKALKAGYLYDWETAQKVAPKGWHLPSSEEYNKLLQNFGESPNPHKIYDSLLINAYKFNILNCPGYYQKNEKRGYFIKKALIIYNVRELWTSTYEISSRKDTLYNYFSFHGLWKSANVSFTTYRNDFLPIRCIKDSI